MKRRIEVAVAFIGEDLICHLAKALARARALHPEFAESAQLGAGVILDEAEELWDAVTVDESQERQNEEATDVVVTGIRFLRGEPMPHIGRDMPYRGGAQLTGAWIDESSLLPEPEKLDFEPGRLSATIHEGPTKQDHLLMPGEIKL